MLQYVAMLPVLKFKGGVEAREEEEDKEEEEEEEEEEGEVWTSTIHTRPCIPFSTESMH